MNYYSLISSYITKSLRILFKYFFENFLKPVPEFSAVFHFKTHHIVCFQLFLRMLKIFPVDICPTI